MRSPGALLSLVVLVMLCGAHPVTGWAEPETSRRAEFALPGLYRIASATAHGDTVALYAGTGYGFASSIFGDGDGHHRALATFAASIGVVDWLALGVRFDGRYDYHTGLAVGDGGSGGGGGGGGGPDDPPMDDDNGDDTDDGLVGEPRLVAQARTPLAGPDGAWHAAARLVLWLPGADAPSIVPEAITADAVAAITYAPPGGPWALALNTGFRFDRSAESSDNAAMLSRSDRLSLGLSEANAVLLGVGGAYRTGELEFITEATWDLLIGAQAPPLSQSPLRLVAGARLALSATTTAQLMLEANLAELPTAAPDDPLSPYAPEVFVSAGVHVQFGAAEPESVATTTTTIAEEATPAPAEPTPPATAALAGRVAGAGGTEVPNAVVTLEADGSSRELGLDPDGRFRISELETGAVTVTVTAEGFAPTTRELRLQTGEERILEIELDPILPPGQIRGYVRSFRGRGLSAELTVTALDPEQSEPADAPEQAAAGADEVQQITTQADGQFELNVAPGRYEITVRALGYRQQRRQVTVEQAGVVILNIDLRRARRR